MYDNAMLAMKMGNPVDEADYGFNKSDLFQMGGKTYDLSGGGAAKGAPLKSGGSDAGAFGASALAFLGDPVTAAVVGPLAQESIRRRREREQERLAATQHLGNVRQAAVDNRANAISMLLKHRI